MQLTIRTPDDVAHSLRDRLRRRRLALNLSQAGLAERSGVNLHSLRRFEKTGLISFASLLKLALVLGVLDDFDRVGTIKAQLPEARSLDEILTGSPHRNRGRMK